MLGEGSARAYNESPPGQASFRMNTPSTSQTFDPSPLTHALREHGYALAIFSPTELQAAEVKQVEDRLVQLGNEVIEDLRGLAEPTSESADNSFNPSPLTRELREHGYAVVIFSPSETDGVDADDLEDRLVELGNEVIETLASMRKASMPSRHARPGR